MISREIAKALLLLAFMTNSASALAGQSSASLSFDCDAPADRFSSVSQELSGPQTITGSVQVIQMRSGKTLPVAGVRLSSADDLGGVGFQLVAASSRAKQLDVVVNTKRGGELTRQTIGQVSSQSAYPFRLSLSDNGRATLVIAGLSFEADAVPLSIAKSMAFCSTAQFKFSGLSFAGS